MQCNLGDLLRQLMNGFVMVWGPLTLFQPFASKKLGDWVLRRDEVWLLETLVDPNEKRNISNQYPSGQSRDVFPRGTTLP